MAPTGLLTIDLAAIAANWTMISNRINQKCDGVVCGAVVKADAYGLGVSPIVGKLHSIGCTCFFVATLDEALELRALLGRGPTIVVFGGIEHGLSKEWYSEQLTPVLFDVDHVQQWLSYCRATGERLPCVLKVDTGMHRLGMQQNELFDVLSSPALADQLNPSMLMSHLACADEPEHDLNYRQLKSFENVLRAVKKNYPAIKLSLSNSAGSFLGSDFHFDVCRPGAALYGINPRPKEANPMHPVVRLELPVMQVRTIAKGESVGYGASFIANRETRLATVFGGYGDGLSRFMSNRAYAWFGDTKVAMAGRVSMDSMVFDVTDLPCIPDSLSILNDRQGVDDLARYAGTIGYEVLTNLGRRYYREYIDEHKEG